MKSTTDGTTIIYDGECRLCRASVTWLQLKLSCTALDFHTTDLARYNLTYDECSKQVIVIAENTTYRAAAAVAYLLRARGNTFLSRIIRYSGKFGEIGYHWVATHRNSLPIKALTALLERAAR